MNIPTLKSGACDWAPVDASNLREHVSWSVEDEGENRDGVGRGTNRWEGERVEGSGETGEPDLASIRPIPLDG